MHRKLTRILSLTIVVALAYLALPATTYANYNKHASQNVVEVGIVEQVGSAKRDEDGVLRGFDAEYLSRLSQYAGFDIHYTYYNGFDELLSALEAGKVDMVPGISRTPERENRFLFGERKMGSGTLNLRVRPNDDRYEYGNVEQIATMHLGAIDGSIMATKAREWAQESSIQLNLTEYSTEDGLVGALHVGEIDGAFVNDSVLQDCREILRLEVLDFYMAFNKDQTDLKQSADSAMNRILSEDFLYFEHLESKYQPKRDAPLVFTATEKQFLNAHTTEPLTVAIVANNPPYNETRQGVRQGVVYDYYEHLEEIIAEGGANVSFNYVEYPDFDSAIDAVAQGESDIVGMTCIDATTANQRGLVLTSSYSMQGIARISMPQDQNAASVHTADSQHAAVLNAEKDTLSVYLAREKESYDLVGYKSLEQCYEALQNGEVDCVITSSMRANWILNQHRSGTFVIDIISDSNLPFYAAVAPNMSVLGSILSKASDNSSTDINAIFAQNITPRADVTTVFNRLPLHMVIIFFVIALTAVGSIAFGINRVLRNRAVQKMDKELIAAQEGLLQAYEHDALTGLINRRGALRRVNAELAGDVPYTMMLVSIDNIEAINEAYGHDVGDKVMVEVATRLVTLCRKDREHRVVYRYRMGLFLLVVKDALLTSNNPLCLEIESLARASVSFEDDLSQSGAPKIETVRLHTSMGIATSDGSDDPEHVIRNCNMALDQARNVENDSIFEYSDHLQNDLRRMNEVQDVVEWAIDERSFYMLYQPQIDVATNEVSGYEALVRIASRPVSPSEFIPVAESNGLIRQIGRITTELVVKQLAEWRDAGLELHPVSVNYSSMQAGDVGYLDYLFDLLKTYNIDSSLVKIEITERFFMRDDAETSKFFERLQQEGMQLLMDDFGTGYSSLNYLAYIPVDLIQIDKSIVDAFLTRNATTTEGIRGNNFVRNLILLTHGMGKKVIVEGVEQEWQADLLASFGCDCIQGYYYSRPLPAEEVVAYRP